MLNVFIGYDAREHDAYEVCRHSIIRRSSDPVQVTPLKLKGLRQSGLYYRTASINEEGQQIDTIDGKPYSTDFSFSRFLVPEIARRNKVEGPVVFVDCDFLFLGDISLMVEESLCQGTPVAVVKHNFVPANRRKMDNCIQEPYNRKLWSALMVFQPWHEACMRLTPEVVNTHTGAYLHQFQWCDNHEIGSLHEKWQWIPGVSPTTGVLGVPPQVIHYTEGMPFFEGHENTPFADEWWREKRHMDASKFNWAKEIKL